MSGAAAVAEPVSVEKSADALVKGFAAWATLKLGEVADATEQMQRALLESPIEDGRGKVDAALRKWRAGSPEVRAQVFPSLEVTYAARLARESVSLDLGDIIRNGERAAARWLTKQRRDAEVDKAAGVSDESPEELAARAYRVQSLSSLPVADLLKGASRALDQRDAMEADTYLRAAVAGGRLEGTSPSSSYGSLRRACDAALDEVVPHRAEAADRAEQARGHYERVMRVIAAFADARRALMRADLGDASSEVGSARELIAQFKP